MQNLMFQNKQINIRAEIKSRVLKLETKQILKPFLKTEYEQQREIQMLSMW